MSEQVKKPSFFARAGKWFREQRSEIKKIVWPTGKQVLNNTIIVIVAIIFVGILIWVVDFAFAAIRDLLIAQL